jgi:acetyltransferase-like isoleucine patch superfamily enzyme
VRKLSIGDNSIISFGTQIKGEKSFSTKGNNFVGVHCLINCDEDVKLGFYSGLGPRCNVYSHGSFLPVIKGYPAKFETVVLEDYVWVGMAVTIGGHGGRWCRKFLTGGAECKMLASCRV